MKYTHTKVIWLSTVLLVSALCPSDACKIQYKCTRCTPASGNAILERFCIEMSKGIKMSKKYSSKRKVHDLYWKICKVYGYKSPAEQAGFNSIFTEPGVTYALLEKMWQKQSGHIARSERELKALPDPMSFAQSREARRQASVLRELEGMPSPPDA